MIRVAMVDDQEMIRLGLRTMIAAQPDLDLVGEAADGLAAITLLDTTEADVVLMDLRMPGIDGVEAIRRLRRAHSADTLKIIVLTTFDQDRNVLAAGIREVADGGGALSATAGAALIDHVADERATLVDPDMVARFASLTPREHEIVAAIVSGLDNTRIAAELFLSPFTVKTHANRAMMKVGARDRAQLVSYAVQAGIRP
ncbi:response regulator [Schaalia naturae]|jgi:DNA-binding NarL/FixJ family response regulator|uniref:Response regulator n=1 Tax=Schaalia naturae TaxID=635203 RepID=A0ABW2SIB0_9ACTO